MTIREPWPACWKPGQQSLVVTDVGVQEDPLMLAVHEEPVLRQRRVPHQGELATAEPGQPSDQGELLRHFLESEPDEGTLIVPVIGAPGTGKSHLIRWLWAMMPDREDLVVRHIPREGTSLPSVVERIFHGVEGEQFENLLAALREARNQEEGLDPTERLEHVATRLVFRIVELLEFGFGTDWRRAKDVPEDIRTALCEATALPALLSDAGVRRRLTRPGGAVYQLARDIVDGYSRPPGEDEEELGFQEEDLDLGAVRNAGPYARQMLTTLEMPAPPGMPSMKDAAARILSDALDIASAKVIGLGSVSLTNLLNDFRRSLAADGKQLVLLFEDIAIARGLQLDLVDAMTTPARRAGEAPLCTMRIALAVTSNYWEEQAPATLATRARGWDAEMFDLDVPRTEAVDRAPDLIGRYMNAARYGIEAIRKMPQEELRAGLDNYCDGCRWQGPCHATFGASSHGHGLFPLSVTAARHLSRLADSQVRPRFVLSDVVEPILDQHRAAERHRFPASERWRQRVETAVARRELPELTIAQLRALEDAQLDEPERQRAELVLRAWLGEGDDTEAVLSALALPAALPSRDVKADIGGEPETTVGGQVEQPHQPAPRPAQGDDAEQELLRWAGGNTKLGLELARLLRNSLWQELLAGIRWEEIGYRSGEILALLGIRANVAQQQANIAVCIDNSAGGGAMAVRGAPLITLKPGTSNAELLLAVYRRAQGRATGRYSVADLVLIRELVESAELAVRERVEAAARTDGYLTETAQVMNLAAAALASELRPSDAPLLPWLQDLDLRDASGSDYTPAWTALRGAAMTEYKSTVERIRAVATLSQGGRGAATVVDPTAFDERALANDPGGLRRRFHDTDLSARHARLKELAEQAIQAEAARAKTILMGIAELVGSEESLPLKNIVEAVSDAVATARAGHLLRSASHEQDLEMFQLPSSRKANDANAGGWAAVRTAERGLSLEAVQRLAQLDRATLRTVYSYLTLANSILTASAEAARDALAQRDGGSGTERGETVRQVVRELLEWCEVRE
jgi:hypothetical protein